MFCSKCGTQIADDALFCFKCGNKTQSDSAGEMVVQNIQGVQTVNSDVKEYLAHAKALEVNRYTLQKTINKIERKISTLGYHKNQIKKDVPKGTFTKLFLKIFIIGVFISFAFGIIYSGIYSYMNYGYIEFGGFFSPLVNGGIISLFVSSIVSGVNYYIKADHLYNEYVENIAQDKERVKYEKQQIIELRKQQDDLRDQISDISGVLKNLYALNVIYPKYREMVPIITMWEYLDSGRCTDLAGANGAYNLYESETRQNIIISNLNQAVSMLAQIRDNQFALYEAIEESNAIAERMCYQNESLLSSSKSIEHNSEVAAYNAKFAADNASVSAYIDFCKF